MTAKEIENNYVYENEKTISYAAYEDLISETYDKLDTINIILESPSFDIKNLRTIKTLIKNLMFKLG